MRIVQMETFPISIPYTHQEVSSRVKRGGVTDVIVKLTTDTGLVGWGESCSGADVVSVEQAVKAATPLVIGRDPWDMEAICNDYFKLGLWDFRPMTGQFAFAGIDQALWDLCGQDCGQPLYRLLGGALREEVNYFYYLSRGTEEEIEAQCQDGVHRGYTCFYLKVGVHAQLEERMLAVIRRVIGPDRKIRIDANEAWTVPEAVRLLSMWNERYDIDFCEAPVPAYPVAGMKEVRDRTPVAICANEGLWRESDVLQMIDGRGADVLCFSSYWVGTIRRFVALCHVADLNGLKVVKHTHGEFGIAAAAMHHAMLAAPAVTEGVQQTAQMMADDILKRPLPIKEGPNWGRVSGAGLGVEVDEEKLRKYHQHYLDVGQYLPN